MLDSLTTQAVSHETNAGPAAGKHIHLGEEARGKGQLVGGVKTTAAYCMTRWESILTLELSGCLHVSASGYQPELGAKNGTVGSILCKPALVTAYFAHQVDGWVIEF